MMYLERVKKCAKHWKQINEDLSTEKYQGCLYPIQYGSPNPYLFNKDMAYQMKKCNDAYKCLEKANDDKNYNDWVSSEVERLDTIKIRKIDEILKRITRV